MNVIRFVVVRSIFKQNKTYISQRGLVNSGIRNLQVLKLHNEDNGKVRYDSTYAVKSIQKEKSWLGTALEKIPFLNVHKSRIKVVAYLLYEEIVDNVNYITFSEEFKLPDTFYSWFVIVELHIWMLSVRAMSEGDDGRHFRNGLVEALWADVAERIKRLGIGSSAAMKEHIFELSEQLQAAFIAYDEGLQSSDMVLAGALWRRFYQSETADLIHIEKLVQYVRKHVTLLDNISWDKLRKERSVGWKHVTN